MGSREKDPPWPLWPYPDPETRERRLDELASALRAEVTCYGQSVAGTPLRAVAVPSLAATDKRVLCTANIHGLEFIASQVAFGLLEALAGESGRRLRERAEVWVIPCLNPDGYARCCGLEGRGRLASLRHNGRGVDLNRNFPLPSGATPSRLPGAGSGRAGAITYRGSAALSEPETRSLDEFLRRQGFHASLNLHSFMGTLIPARVLDRRQYKAYRALCEATRAGQPGVRYRTLSSRTLDVFTGELEDHQHHAHNCWAVCLESMTLWASLRQHPRAPATFWRYNPHDPKPWIENDVPAVLSFFQAALDLPRPAEIAEP